MKCLLTNFDECLAGGQGAPTQENGTLTLINSNKGNSTTINKAARILDLEFKQYQDAGGEFDSGCDFTDDIY